MTDPPAGQHTVRHHNVGLVLDAVRAVPGLSRAGVAARTGLAKATVSSLVDQLLAANLLTDTGPQPPRTGPGRPGRGLALSPSGPHGLGAEIGVDYLATCLVDLTGAMSAHRVRPCDNRAQSLPQVMARLARAVRTGLRDARSRGVAVAGAGVAVPGLVDASGVLRSAPNLGWRDVDIAGELGRRVAFRECRVRVGNEANYAARAELTGGDLRDFVHVSGEIGIGSGIVVGGRIQDGVRGFAGELGHVCVDPDGPECGCGSYGCLEAVAGQDALLRSAGVPTAAGSPAGLVERLVERLERGEGDAVAAVRRAGRLLGIALAGVVNVVDVPAVVLGGGYARLAPWLTEPLLRELNGRAVSSTVSPVTVRTSRLGAEAAVLGAGAEAVQALLADPVRYLASTSAGA